MPLTPGTRLGAYEIALVQNLFSELERLAPARK
jgi:hypothetical protein